MFLIALTRRLYTVVYSSTRYCILHVKMNIMKALERLLVCINLGKNRWVEPFQGYNL